MINPRSVPVKQLLVLVVFLILCTACQGQSEVSLPAGTPSATVTAPAPLKVTGTPTPSPLPPDPTTTHTPTFIPTPTRLPRTTMLFTGAIVPGRCVQAAIDERGEADSIYDEVRDLLSSADLAVGTLNSSISDYPPHTGCVRTFVLVGDSRNADALGRAGFDIMSVATNHIKNCGIGDCGDRAFLDTLENLQRVGIQPVGAGENLAQALQPVVMEVNGIRFGFVSLGQVEPLAFAGESSPGIAILNEENLQDAIAAAHQVSDVVIAMPHWGPDYSALPNEWQTYFARVAVEAGADLVVGNHAHVVQAIEEISGVQVFYGLGSFVFDQDWSRETQQGVMVKVSFEGDRYLGYEFIPVHIDGDGTVHISDKTEADEILLRIQQASEKLEKLIQFQQ